MSPTRGSHSRRKRRSQNDKKREAQTEELVRKLPSETEPAQEWGERLATGKAIAKGGKTKEEETQHRYPNGATEP